MHLADGRCPRCGAILATLEELGQPRRELHLHHLELAAEVGHLGADALDGSLRSRVTACCASSGKSATCHGWTPTTDDTQPVENFGAGGISASFPRGAPASTHATMVSISFCESERSPL
mgnify:CR=1 FL=1